jgi:peptide/nickel transport system permease protein
VAIAVLLFVLAGVVGPLIAPYDPNAVDLVNARTSPSGEHWLGTDRLGRDVFSRLLAGAQTSLLAIVLVLSGAIAIGAVIGVVAGVVGGIVDEILMRLTDVGLSLPSMVVALAVLGARGPGFGNMIFALTLAWWPAYARLTRTTVVSLRHQPHVEAVRVLGASPFRVLRRHLLPPAVAPTLVYASGDAGFVALAVATLSFLGIGVQPPRAEWGQMLVDGLPALERLPLLVILPGLALTFAVVIFNLLGESVALQAMPRAPRGRALARRLVGLPGPTLAAAQLAVVAREGVAEDGPDAGGDGSPGEAQSIPGWTHEGPEDSGREDRR